MGVLILACDHTTGGSNPIASFWLWETLFSARIVQSIRPNRLIRLSETVVGDQSMNVSHGHNSFRESLKLDGPVRARQCKAHQRSDSAITSECVRHRKPR